MSLSPHSFPRISASFAKWGRFLAGRGSCVLWLALLPVVPWEPETHPISIHISISTHCTSLTWATGTSRYCSRVLNIAGQSETKWPTPLEPRWHRTGQSTSGNLKFLRRFSSPPGKLKTLLGSSEAGQRAASATGKPGRVHHGALQSTASLGLASDLLESSPSLGWRLHDL